MIITCPDCATRYRIPEGALGEEGRSVRCKGCSYEWLAIPPKPGQVAPEAETPESEPEDPQADTADTFENELERAAAEPVLPRRSADIESAARERDAKRRRDNRGRRVRRAMMAIAASLLVTVYSGYTYRNALVTMVPAAEPLFRLAGMEINLVGFDFSNVRVEREYDGGLPVLKVAGEVVNVSGQSKAVPRVRFGLRDEARQEIYHWTMAVSEEALPPQGRLQFSTKLAAPPAEARDVLVKFNPQPGRRQASIFGGASQ